MSWLPEHPGGGTGTERLLALRPELAADLSAFDALLWNGRALDPGLLEACRRRVAAVLGAEPSAGVGRIGGARRSGATGGTAAIGLAGATGGTAAIGMAGATGGEDGNAANGAQPEPRLLDPRRLEGLGAWREADVFDARERACLAFAERFALEPHGLTDAEAEAVTVELAPRERVALAEALAIFDGFTRFALVLGADDPRAAATPGRPPGSAAAGAALPGAGAARPAARAARRGGAGRATRAPLVQPPEVPGADAIARSVLAHQPELLAAFLRLYGTLWSHGVVDHPTKEVLRLRNAAVTDCNYCRNVRFSEARRQGLDEAQVAQIDDDFEESTLSGRYKLALRLADLFLVAPGPPPADLRAALLDEFTPAEIVEMTAGLALFMGFSKITVALGREPAEMATTVVPTPQRPPVD